MSAASKARWYWRRLQSMGPAEIGFRAWRQLGETLARAARLDAVRAPKIRHVADGARWIGPMPAIDPTPYRVAANRILAGTVPAFERAEIEIGSPPRWNRDPRTGRSVPMRYGPSIDYRDAAVTGDPKYLWEPNRHQHLVTLAQCHALTGETRHLDTIGTHIASWLEQCPCPLGLNWTSALEAGIRLINWSVTWQLIGGAESLLFRSPSGSALREAWLSSVYQHARFIRRRLSRFSSANNHLMGELAGLYVAGVTWPLWPAMDAWRLVARGELEREAVRQNAPDGVNREQAVGYHVHTLDFLLVSGLAARAAGEGFSEVYWQRLRAMASFLSAIAGPGDSVPMFGDCDGGVVVRWSPQPGRPEALRCVARVEKTMGGVAGSPGEDEGASWLPAGPRLATIPSRRAFPDGGYYVLGTAAAPVHVVADAGPLGMPPIYAHGHADALSFTLAIGGIPFLVDPGTGDYYLEREWRDYFRSTAAHNTVQVDGVDQSVTAGAFLWRSAASVTVRDWKSSPEADVLDAEHDGYQRLPDPVVHRRVLRLDHAAGRLEVTDVLACLGSHQVRWHWHFDPACEVGEGGDGTIEIRRGVVSLRITWPSWLAGRVVRGGLDPRGGWYSPAFGERIPCATLTLSGAIHGETSVGITMIMGNGVTG